MKTLRIAHNTPCAQRAQAEAYLAGLPTTTFANETLASVALCRAPRALWSAFAIDRYRPQR